jgi:hypothetical protein
MLAWTLEDEQCQRTGVDMRREIQIFTVSLNGANILCAGSRSIGPRAVAPHPAAQLRRQTERTET